MGYMCLNLVLEDFAIPKLNLSDLVLGYGVFKELLVGAESVSKGVFCPFFFSAPFCHVSAKQMLHLVPGHTVLQRLAVYWQDV